MFDICKGPIPGSHKLIFHPHMLTIATMGGVAIISPFAKRIFNRLPPATFYQERAYQLISRLPSLSSRQIVLGSKVVISICLIGAFYPYLRLFLASPFRKSFAVRLRYISPHLITGVMGVVICVGTKIITTCFGVRVIPNAVSQLQITIFGHKTTVRDLTPENSQESVPSTSIVPMSRSFTLKEILQIHFFPHVINNTPNFEVFNKFRLVCKEWKALLEDPNCLVPESSNRSFFWKAFRDLHFDPIEVTAFYERYLPKGHAGAKLRLPFRFLRYQSSLENSLTPGQLAYILHRFPEASIDAFTLRLSGQDDVVNVASLLNKCLEPSKKLYSLTIVPERLRNEQEQEFYGKLLSKETVKKRTRYICDWEATEYQRNYTTKIMELLPLLKGKATFLRIDFRKAKEDRDLDPVEIIQLFDPQLTTPSLIIDRLDFSYYWELQCPPRKDREKIESAIEHVDIPKPGDIFVSCPTPKPEVSHIDETLLEQETSNQPKKLKVRNTRVLL